MHPLIKFLKDYTDTEIIGDELHAYDKEDNQIDALLNVERYIRDYLENHPDNKNGLEGAEIVDNMGGYRAALEEIKSEL